MFDSVLSKSAAPQGNVAGLGWTLLVCGSIAGAVIWGASQVRKHSPPPVDVMFVAAQSAATTVTTAAAAEPSPAPQPQPRKPRKTLSLRPKAANTLTAVAPAPDAVSAPSAEADPAPTTDSTQGGPAEGGGAAASSGPATGAVGSTTAVVLPFGQGMTRPAQIAGRAPEYNREALAARAAGKVLIRCVITVAGTVKDCTVIKGVPMLDQIVLESLRDSRYTPVMYQGRPTAVQYLFTFNFKLP